MPVVSESVFYVFILTQDNKKTTKKTHSLILFISFEEKYINKYILKRISFNFQIMCIYLYIY